ncbi:MAG TPA: hypothetical protein VMB46_09655 [Methanomassiliicoccales archaeon]|nr:hypothetical protein [Methanomassiliicoccales archaeon]
MTAGFSDVELFDVRPTNQCGQKPCAWGVAPYKEYQRLASKFLEPDEYRIAFRDNIVIDGVRLKADMTIIDKPRLIHDLVQDAEVHLGPIPLDAFERVVDATGVERAYLGPAIGPELIADCVQYRVRSEADLGLWFKTTGLGYEWCFPLGDGEFHMGFGNLAADMDSYRPLATMGEAQAAYKPRCKCRSRVRLSSPFYSRPFTNGKVVGVGESIGSVGPLGADGNLYAMQCAELLIDHWDDLRRYESSVLKKYDWMRREREALEKMVKGRVPPLRDVRVFTSHSKRVGIELGPVQALQLFKRAIDTSRGRS